jgi:hypothetical protein
MSLKDHLHVSPILHYVSACFLKSKKVLFIWMGSANAKSASEIDMCKWTLRQQGTDE